MISRRRDGRGDPIPSGTTAAVLLAHHLMQLKLPTILREHEKLAREAAPDGVDHVRYLLRLAELELLDRERRVTERRIREAGEKFSSKVAAAGPEPNT